MSDVDDEIKRLEAELEDSDSDSDSSSDSNDSGSKSDSDSSGGGGGGGGDDDEEMKKLLKNWETNDSDSSSDDSDDSDEEDRRDIELDDNVLDHIVLCAPDLEDAIDEFEDKTSIKPKIAGSIKGLGIKTARISFEGSQYLEIIAPDPNSAGPIGNLLQASGVKGLRPFHYAIRNVKCEDMKSDVGKMGYTPDHISMFGAKEDGTPRKWEMLYLYGHKMGGICPFFINWANSDHPCETLPIVGRLKNVTVTAPAGDNIHKLFKEVAPGGIECEEGPKHFEFSFSSPEGTLTFESSKMVGFRFPGFEEECGPIDGEDDEDDGSDSEKDKEFPSMPALLPTAAAGGGGDDGDDDAPLAIEDGDAESEEEVKKSKKEKKEKKEKKKKKKH